MLLDNHVYTFVYPKDLLKYSRLKIIFTNVSKNESFQFTRLVLPNSSENHTTFTLDY